jgi:cardiolipin synthase A/B
MGKVTTWKFLTSSESAWEVMLQSFEKARRSIDVEQFVFGSDGPIIEEVAAMLLKKIKKGVRVRLLIDAIGSFSFYSSQLRKDLEEEGIEIIFHSTVVPPSLKRIVPAFLRDHRKLIIIDGKEVHLGGVIIEERARTWRDTTVVFKGSLVEACQSAFDTVWEQTGQMKPVGSVLSHNGKGEFCLVGNSFRLRDKHLYRMMIRNIAEAKKTIYITTPYFAPSYDLRRALRYARTKGVEVYILLPKRSDNLPSDILGRFFYASLLRKGVKIHHYTESVLHAKTMSIDGSWATIGSSNLDWLSSWLNYELNLVSENADFATELDQIFLNDLTKSEEVTFKTKGWWGMW